MGFWLNIWRAQKTDGLREENEYLKSMLKFSEHRVRVQEQILGDANKREDELVELLSKILIAVGRVKVFEDQPTSSFAALPELVSMVVTDHEDLEGRIDAVVEYLRSLDPASDIDGWAVRNQVGRLLQGAEPQIVDLQGGTDIEKE
jgi:hypothetical protein